MKYIFALMMLFTVGCNKEIIDSETLAPIENEESQVNEVDIDIDINLPVGTTVINTTPTPSPTPTPTPSPTTDGLSCKVYDFSGKDKILTADLSSVVYLGSFVLPKVDVTLRDWSLGFPYFPSSLAHLREYYLIDCRGYIKGNGKKVNMTLTSDDGSVMFINKHLRIDNDGLHASVSKSANVKLKKGNNKIRLLWFQGPRQHIQLELKVDGVYATGLSH